MNNECKQDIKTLAKMKSLVHYGQMVKHKKKGYWVVSHILIFIYVQVKEKIIGECFNAFVLTVMCAIIFVLPCSSCVRQPPP